MKTDISKFKKAIIEEAKDSLVVPAAEDEITVAELAEESGCTVDVARNILNKKVKEGSMTVRKNGPFHSCIYKPVDGV